MQHSDDDKTVSVSCPFTIQRNPADFVDFQKKAMLAHRVGVRNAMRDEISRLKRLNSQVQTNIGSELHVQTTMTLDYLEREIYQMFPDEHTLPVNSHSASLIRNYATSLTNRGTKVSSLAKNGAVANNGAYRNKMQIRGLPRRYRIFFIALVALTVFGACLALLLYALL